MDMTEPTWVSAERPPVPELSPPNGESVQSPQTTLKEEDGKLLAFLCLCVCVQYVPAYTQWMSWSWCVH